MRALITGITGFVGPHLAEHLLTAHPECEVWGLAWGEAGRQQLEPLKPRLQLVEADLTKPESILPAIRTARPDVVFHLAAASSVASSWTSPALFVEVNVIGQINLLEALRAEALDPVVVVSSSADVYGRIAAELLPACEDLPLLPVSPYGLSKAGQDLCAYQYFAAHSLRTVRLRLFNHTGPRRPSSFVLSSFARQLAEIETGRSAPTVKVGNLDAVRDFLDVRDVARAYWLAATRGRAGEAYNVCSGVGLTIREVLQRLLALSQTRVEVTVDPERLRPADVPVLYGDHSRFTAATGWRPEIALEQTLADMLAWWRAAVGRSGV